MKKDKLLTAPKRKWDETLYGVKEVWIVPTDNLHDSGYSCMEFVAETPKGRVKFGGGCDVLELLGNKFKIDCDPEEKLLRIFSWNERGFRVTHDLSAISLVEEGYNGLR